MTYLHPNLPRNVRALADNPRTQVKAAIKRASAAARDAAGRLDREVLAGLEEIFRRARSLIAEDIARYAGDDGNVHLDVLRDLLRQVDVRIAELTRARDALLDDGLGEAARLGAGAFAAAQAELATPLTQLADEAVRFVRTFVAEDGLQLSDRLWRLERQARTVVREAIEDAVIQGWGADRAVAEFLERGQAVPAELRAKIGKAAADRIGRIAGAGLMTGEGSPYDNARRLFRTEINRAHGEAYQRSAFEHPDVIGTRFLLSPNHPRRDICDLHATVNRWGLGPGVYPKGKNPWPAHPNTLSYTEVVFRDEVTDQDREGKEDRIAWLEEQPESVQNAVLGIGKADLLRAGLLREGMIGTPLRVLKRRFGLEDAA